MNRGDPTGEALAGRWLSKFLTDHLAGERDLSAQTIASYRDAVKLLLTWFRDVQQVPPEKLHLADLDRSRVLSFLDWLQTERGNSASTRNQRLAVMHCLLVYLGPNPALDQRVRPRRGGRETLTVRCPFHLHEKRDNEEGIAVSLGGRADCDSVHRERLQP